VADSDTGAEGSEGRRFDTTRWSLVVAARDHSNPDARQALETLCRTYWFPIYAYVRRHGSDSEQARDLTQGFFCKLLERGFSEASRERGKFRTFLLTSLQNFLADEWDRERALKRGGGREPIPLDATEAERAYALDPAHDDTPEKIFERKWARTLLNRSFERFDEEMAASSQRERFSRLRSFLTGEATEAYRDAARELDMEESAVRVAVHRMRRRFGAILREEVAHTIGAASELDAELRYLLEVVRT